MEHIESLPEFIKGPMLSCLAPIPVIDKFLIHYGADSRRHPSSYVGEWVDHLAWGVDSAVTAVRLLLCGQVVGAATIARTQFERWTMHRAFNANIQQSPGEKTIDYIARTWSSGDVFKTIHQPVNHSESFPDQDDEIISIEEPESDHQHIHTSDGFEICPPMLYGLLSEMMHGRELIDAIGWDGESLLRSQDWPDEVFIAIAAITDTITLCLRQIRIAGMSIAAEAGDASGVRLMRASLDGFSEPSEGNANSQEDAGDTVYSTKSSQEPTFSKGYLAAPPLIALAPLLPREGLRDDWVHVIEAMANTFTATSKGHRPAGRLFQDDEFVMYAFAWHRSRSVRFARSVMLTESEDLGDNFDIDAFGGSVNLSVALTEAASLLAKWHPRQESAAAASLIGSAVRSSYWLWLEDDSRALGILRCVLEQTSRLRVWRMKPDKAMTLEQRAETTPRDWLEKAGWKRLSALHKALGEYAHTSATSKWSGAHQLLAQLQPGADPDRAILTARGAAIDFVALLAAREITTEIHNISEPVAITLEALFERYGFDMSKDSSKIESHFNHIWEKRGASLGDPDFRMPSAE